MSSNEPSSSAIVEQNQCHMEQKLYNYNRDLVSPQRIKARNDYWYSVRTMYVLTVFHLCNIEDNENDERI